MIVILSLATAIIGLAQPAVKRPDVVASPVPRTLLAAPTDPKMVTD